MSNQLALTNVVTISVSQGNPGAGNYNTSNLALFTDDAPQSAIQTIAFSGVAASGAFVLTFGSTATASISWNDTIQAIQNKINAVTAVVNVVVSGSLAAGALTLTQPGQFGTIVVPTVTTNTLMTAGSAAITVTPSTTNAGWSGGTAGYAAYMTPTQLGLDFGTSSKTFTMGNAVFSQQPNILNGGGQLIVILLQTQVTNLALSLVAASGAIEITYNGSATASIAWNATTGAIQTALQAVTGCSEMEVTGTITGQSLNIYCYGVYSAALTFSTTSNTLLAGNSSPVVVSVSTTTAAETIGAAITRTQSLVQYFGIMVNESCGTSQVIPQADVLAAAAIVQALVKLIFFVTNSQTDLTATTGLVALVTSATESQTRMLYYGDTSSAGVQNALNYCGAYSGLGLSVNFSGSGTTITMHLKALSGITPDPNMTQAMLNKAVVAGADCYVSLQGVSAIYTSGANSFYDQIYNLLWFTGALQIAGFNYLAQTSAKIPQTENGITGLKGAYRSICQQGVTNGYLAPGTWTSATTFGNQTDLINNIAAVGYYIYSTPIAQQTAANRAARQAPLIQIAGKQAGAVQSSNVIVTVNP